MDMVEAFQQAWPAISMAPWQLLTLGVVIFLAGFGLAKALNAERIAIMEAHLNEFRHRLGNATPKEVAERIDELSASVKKFEAPRLDQNALTQMANVADSIDGVIHIEYEAGSDYALPLMKQIKHGLRLSSAQIELVPRDDLTATNDLITIVGSGANRNVELLRMAFGAADIRYGTLGGKNADAQAVIRIVEPLHTRVEKLSKGS